MGWKVVSVIIPCYKVKLEDIVNQLDGLIEQNEECELIFSDGERDYFNSFIPSISSMLYGSPITLKIVQNYENHTVLSRGESMNLAAKNAKGDILLFLHLDTILPKNAIKIINNVMNEEKVVAGGFLKRYDAGFFLCIIEKILNIRTKIFRRMVGTNAIFVRKSIFEKRNYINSFLEDLDYSDYLLESYSKDSIRIVYEYVKVSSIKYKKHGVLKGVLKNSLIMFLYRLKLAGCDDLEKLYKKEYTLCEISKIAYKFVFKSRENT